MRMYRGDESGLRMLIDALDLAFETHHALGLGPGTQILRIQAGVEMVGVSQSRQQRPWVRCGKFKLARQRRYRVQRIVLEVVRMPFELRAQPAVLKRNPVARKAKASEGMEISMPGLSPAPEFDTQLVGGLRLLHELSFIETDNLIEPVNGRNGGFAHSDGTDVVGFDQRDRTLPQVDGSAQRRGGHPAGRAAADDDDLADAIVPHRA